MEEEEVVASEVEVAIKVMVDLAMEEANQEATIEVAEVVAVDTKTEATETTVVVGVTKTQTQTTTEMIKEVVAAAGAINHQEMMITVVVMMKAKAGEDKVIATPISLEPVISKMEVVQWASPLTLLTSSPKVELQLVTHQ